MLPPGVEAVERTQRGVTHRHVLPPFPPGRVARHRLVQNVRSRSNSETASLHPELPRLLPSHAGSTYTELSSFPFSIIFQNAVESRCQYTLRRDFRCD